MHKLISISWCILLLFTSASAFGVEILAIGDTTYFLPVGHDSVIDYSKFRNRIIGKYGEYRQSWVKGHKHSGIDIKGNFSEPIYPIAKGTVTHIFRGFPHKTIYVRHHQGAGRVFYSVYIHVEDIRVGVGDWVTGTIPMARIFNKEELLSSHFGTPPHLHLEIRHNISDKGNATFKCMSMTELNRYCVDPLGFFQKVFNPFSLKTLNQRRMQ